MRRPATVTPKDVAAALAVLGRAIERRRAKHGTAPYATRHHALGVAVEEWHEAIDAIRDDVRVERFGEELIDLAVVAVWELASAAARARGRRR